MSDKGDLAIPFIKSVTGTCDAEGEAITLTVEAKNGASFDVAMTPTDLGKTVSRRVGDEARRSWRWRSDR